MGRHSQPRRAGLPPVLSGAAIVAVVTAVGILVQPQAAPDATLALPAPAPAVGAPTSPPPPTTTPIPTSAPAPTLSAPTITVKPAPTMEPTATSAEPTKAPAAKTATAAGDPKCHNVGVKPQVVKACDQITAAVPGITAIGGRAARPHNPTSCHPSGLALDLMVYGNTALGDRIYAYARAHKAELGVTTLLWQVPDHYDHVHASVTPCNH